MLTDLLQLVTAALITEKPSQFREWSGMALVFSVLWSVGGCLPLDSREKFSVMLRNYCLDKDARPKTVVCDKNTIYPEKGLFQGSPASSRN